MTRNISMHRLLLIAFVINMLIGGVELLVNVPDVKVARHMATTAVVGVAALLLKAEETHH